MDVKVIHRKEDTGNETSFWVGSWVIYRCNSLIKNKKKIDEIKLIIERTIDVVKKSTKAKVEIDFEL